MKMNGKLNQSSCDPCLSDKQIKKQNEESIKEIKTAINILHKHMNYEKESISVVGYLMMRLIQLTGPLK